jgi:hypothetical protein
MSLYIIINKIYYIVLYYFMEHWNKSRQSLINKGFFMFQRLFQGILALEQWNIIVLIKEMAVTVTYMPYSLKRGRTLLIKNI